MALVCLKLLLYLLFREARLGLTTLTGVAQRVMAGSNAAATRVQGCRRFEGPWLELLNKYICQTPNQYV